MSPRMYQRDQLPGGHIIMLGSSEENQKAALEALKAFPNGMQVGGKRLISRLHFINRIFKEVSPQIIVLCFLRAAPHM
jgi:hypothetical protein